MVTLLDIAMGKGPSDVVVKDSDTYLRLARGGECDTLTKEYTSPVSNSKKQPTRRQQSVSSA